MEGKKNTQTALRLQSAIRVGRNEPTTKCVNPFLLPPHHRCRKSHTKRCLVRFACVRVCVRVNASLGVRMCARDFSGGGGASVCGIQMRSALVEEVVAADNSVITKLPYFAFWPWWLTVFTGGLHES